MTTFNKATTVVGGMETQNVYFSGIPVFNVLDEDDRIPAYDLLTRYEEGCDPVEILAQFGIEWGRDFTRKGTLYWVLDISGKRMKVVSMSVPLYRYLLVVNTISALIQTSVDVTHSVLCLLFPVGEQVTFLSPSSLEPNTLTHLSLVMPESVAAPAQQINCRHNLGAGKGDLRCKSSAEKREAFQSAISFLDTGLLGYVSAYNSDGPTATRIREYYSQIQTSKHAIRDIVRAERTAA